MTRGRLAALLAGFLAIVPFPAAAEVLHLGFEPPHPSAADAVALVVSGHASCPFFGDAVVQDDVISVVYVGDFCLSPPIPFNRAFFLGFLAAGTYQARLVSETGDVLCSEELVVAESGLECDQGSLCLHGGRFAVRALWEVGGGQRGEGMPLALGAETGVFSFFSPGNVEVVVKVLAACGVNQRFWVFAAGLTDVEVRLRVTDTLTGEEREYANPQGRPFAPVQDTDAFAICPQPGPPPPGA